MVELIPFVLIVFYFLPFCLAAARAHENTTGVFLLNAVLGWTVLGWVLALVWASTGERYTPPVGLSAPRRARPGRPVLPRILDEPAGRLREPRPRPAPVVPLRGPDQAAGG